MVAVGATHLRLLAVTAAACMVVMTVACSSAVNKSLAPGSSETPQKPEFTQVTTSMFVDRSVRGHVEVPAGGREMSPLPCRD